jgi:TBC1 domain family member 13
LQIALTTKKASEDYAPMEEGSEAHWEVVQRILFLYAKLNPGQGYVQGMNEIIGPIYYTFATDPNTEWRGNDRYDFMIFFADSCWKIQSMRKPTASSALPT